MAAALTVGFIGIGNMGWPMAANLGKAGHAVIVHDADPQRAGSANPSASPPFVSELAASIAAAADAGRSGPRIRDPALRSALLRARLLRDWKAI